MNFNKHITAIKGKATASITKLYPLLKSHSALGLTNGLIIYKMLIRPVMTYAPAIWGNTSKTNHQKLQTVQNRVLKMITAAPRYTRMQKLHKDLKVEYLKDYTLNLARSFYERCEFSQSPLIQGLGQYDHDPLRKRKMRLPRDFISEEDAKNPP